ncbi:hypothetical protein C0J52_01605 [Blattella germanica]|nr:hypothetical protein C0J52_01605 [Blattella germanica]
MLQESHDTSRAWVEKHVGISCNVESAKKSRVPFIRPELVLGLTLGSTKQVVISTKIAIGVQFRAENSQRFDTKKENPHWEVGLLKKHQAVKEQL